MCTAASCFKQHSKGKNCVFLCMACVMTLENFILEDPMVGITESGPNWAMTGVAYFGYMLL